MSPHDASATGDVPEVPAPRVREFTAHSIGGGFALLLGLAGLALVVLCGDRAPQPVLNTGSLHQ
ncbi:hypothetical protein GCM10022206_72480 [Streptomyces chiangmaiensis]